MKPRALLVHAASEANALYAAALGADVSNVTVGSFSGAYDDQTGIARTVRSVPDAFRKYAPAFAPGATRCALVGFSAGCWAVRAWLNAPGAEMAEAVVFVDGLHAGGTDQRATLGPQHAGVLAYARRALEGKCALVITHSQIVPPGYASTRATADAVLAALDLSRPSRLGVFQRSGLVVVGCPGDDKAAHSRQLLVYGPDAARKYARPALDGAEPVGTPSSGVAPAVPASVVVAPGAVPVGSAPSSEPGPYTVGVPTDAGATALKLFFMWLLRKVFG